MASSVPICSSTGTPAATLTAGRVASSGSQVPSTRWYSDPGGRRERVGARRQCDVRQVRAHAVARVVAQAADRVDQPRVQGALPCRVGQVSPRRRAATLVEVRAGGATRTDRRGVVPDRGLLEALLVHRVAQRADDLAEDRPGSMRSASYRPTMSTLLAAARNSRYPVTLRCIVLRRYSSSVASGAT